MRTQRYSDFGEPSRYVGALRTAALHAAAFLLFAVLSLTAIYVTSELELADKARASYSAAARQVLFVALGPPRVGVQIGHDGAAAHPDELGHLRGNTGGFALGRSEVSVNRAVAAALRGQLEASGVTVDLLRATPPAGYHADLVLSLHTDSLDPEVAAGRRGYKSAYFSPPRSPLEPRLKRLIDEGYLRTTRLPDDTANTTGAMSEYYAFNFRRYRSSVHPATPALIVELGYLSSPDDAALLDKPQRVAAGLRGGVVAFLQSRNRLP